jgi:stage V sporulation protein B
MPFQGGLRDIQRSAVPVYRWAARRAVKDDFAQRPWKAGDVRRIFSVALASFFVIELPARRIMLFFSGPLAQLMHDAEAAYSILALSPAMLFVCLICRAQGVFPGPFQHEADRASQLIEVTFKLAVGLTLAEILLKRGYGLPVASAGATFGVTVSEAAGTVCMFGFKRRNNYCRADESNRERRRPGNQGRDTWPSA